MNEAGEGDPSVRRRRFGCLPRVAAFALIGTAIVVGIGFLFDQGDSARQPDHTYDAGPASAYQSGTVVYAEAQHLYVVRLKAGDFMALYDKSPKQQELRSDCRVTFDDSATTGMLDPLPGLTGGFVENCSGMHAVWRADGVFAFGASYGNLDRFPASVDGNGHLIIDTSTRTCTRSRGVIGVPPFDAGTCGSGD
jgi:hypothetical protein